MFAIRLFDIRRDMNKTKKWLIIVAIIFNLIETAYSIYTVVQWFMMDPDYRLPVFYVVFEFIAIACSILIDVLLVMSIWNNGKLFRQRYGYYMTAVVLSIIVNLPSVSCVLLIVTMFISDWVWINPKDDKTIPLDDKTEVIKESKEDKIARLRKLRNEGKISEEEFERQLMDLL